MKLFYIESHEVQQQLGEDIAGAPAKEASKAVVLLKHANGAFGLNGAVHTQHNADMSELKLSDIDVKFSRNRNDSLLVKAQGLLNQLQAGVHPRIALTTVDLYSDPEAVYYESQRFMEKWTVERQTEGGY